MRVAQELRAARSAEDQALAERKKTQESPAIRSHLDRADRAYKAALDLLPQQDRLNRLRIELARGNLSMLRNEAPAALGSFNELAKKADAAGAPPELRSDIRELQGAASYAIAWAIRRQGGPPAEWKAQAKLASQSYRALAESARKDRDPRYFTYEKNLETAVNLLKVDRSIFDVLAFPGNSPATEDCLRKLKEQRESELRNQTKPKPQPPSPPDDGRKKVRANAGVSSDVPAEAAK